MNFPVEVLLVVVDFCDRQSLLNLRRTSRKINEICEPTFYRFLLDDILARRHYHLHRAVSSCRLNSVQRLIGNGAPVMQRNLAGETPLHIASRDNYVAGVEILIRCKQDLDVTTFHGWTALQLAARYGNEEIVTLLLQNGSNPNIRGFHGWTALHYAARTGHGKLAELLIEAGACTDILDNDQKTPAQLARAL